MSTQPHVHDHDEVVYFIGSDPKDIGDLGAEVNFKMGPKGQEADNIFSVPTAVVIPKRDLALPDGYIEVRKAFPVHGRFAYTKSTNLTTPIKNSRRFDSNLL